MPAVQSYIICGTPRSGSTLLCDLLENTEVAGRPASYFRKESIPRWASRLNVPVADEGQGANFDQSYIDAVVKAGKGETDLFGLRLMWESLDELSVLLGGLFPGLKDDRTRLEAAFGPPLFIHLSRTDKVSQAVSRVKASQTGLWHVAADGTERERTSPAHHATYNRDEISKYVEELVAHDQDWNRWFEKHGIDPLRLNYETLSRDTKGALATVLSALGLDPSIAASVEPKTTRMSDAESQSWVARYRSETRLPSG